MAVSTLDPNTALVVIDLQKGILSFPAAHPTAAIVERAAALAKAFRRHGLPVVLVNVDGAAPGRTEQPRRSMPASSEWAELLPELDPQSSDVLVTKKTWGAFASTDIEPRLREQGVTQIVLAGIATSAGVESTARQAFEAGFHVTLATDAMTDMSAEAHDNSVKRIFPRLGETGTADEIIAILERNGATQ